MDEPAVAVAAAAVAVVTNGRLSVDFTKKMVGILERFVYLTHALTEHSYTARYLVV